MRKTMSLFLALVMLLSVCSFASAEETEYTVKTVPVFRGTEQAGSMDLRYYSDAPNVACYGMKAYLNLLRGEELTVTAEDGGLWTVTAPNDTSIQVNPAAGTITAADWARFQSPLTPYDKMVGIKDSPCAWSYYTDLTFTDEPAAVIFNLAKYSIPLHADREDVYMPLALLATMFTDVATNRVIFNGEKAFLSVLDVNAIGALPDGFYDPMKALISGEEQRSEDVIRVSYGELCFVLDYFFGHPGTGAWDESIREIGLDETLKAKGPEIREALLSPVYLQHVIGLQKLTAAGLDDGHTAYTGISPLVNPAVTSPEAVMKIVMGAGEAINTSSISRMEMMNSLRQTRAAVWGDEVYRECGSTAILRIDAFAPDDKGWEAYYAGTGEIPMDAFGITVTGLKKASENPAIKNVLFDLSSNTGGSSDLLMAVLSLCDGNNRFDGYNVLTGQHMYAACHVDRNLDGVIDEKDDEVKYDFRYAVLTTRMAFSCGNLFPFLMQDSGAVLLGESTGGGSCCVQFAELSGGDEFLMSSYLWALRDRKGESVEGGCNTDLPIARIEPEKPTHPNPRLSNGDYTPYFDDVKLDKMINEWYAAREEKPAV